MTSLVTAVVTGASWCFCTACASLLGSCCGNDKPSTVPPSLTSGRKRSVTVLLLSLAMSLGFQYGLAPYVLEHDVPYLSDAWRDGCTQYDHDVELQKSCAGNHGVYRVAAATTLFFVLAAIAVACKPTANREAWPAKFVLLFFLVAATVVIPSDPLFADIYLNLGRIGGVIFIFLQQLIILDVAYDWNESWVGKADRAEAQEPGSGQNWYGAVLAACAILYLLTVIGLVMLLLYFTGCTNNNGFIAFTLAMCVAITAAQLTGEHGSLLSSACISLWATFLCFTAVSKNPNAACNPKLGEPDNVSIAMAMIVTVISLGWTGFSWTAEDKLTAVKAADTDDTEEKPAPPAAETAATSTGGRKVTGFVAGPQDEEEGTGANSNGAGSEGDDDDELDEALAADTSKLSNSWKLNAVLGVITCWMAMALTNWGSIYAGGNAANPQAGRTGMWMIIASQWLVLTLYLWTLVAPRLLPNRDFS